MKKVLLACGMVFAMQASAQDTQVVTELNGMDLDVERLGMGTDGGADQPSLVGVPAVRVSNHSEERVSCQFHAESEASRMALSPAFTIDPGGQEVMRVPGDDYPVGGPVTLLACGPSSASAAQRLPDAPVR